MFDREEIDLIIQNHGYEKYKWINAADIDVAEWVRFKCMFGCSNYGRNASCPPNVPSVAECRAFFKSYEHAVIFHFPKTLEDPEKRHEWSRQVSSGLIKLEREVFLAGNRKTFVLAMDECSFCRECAGAREICNNPRLARPSIEAMAVDVYATVRKYGFQIEVLRNFTDTMNRYAFLMVD